MDVMYDLGEHPTEERIKEMILQVDNNADGVIDFDEFTCLMVKHIKDIEDSPEELVLVFKRFDKDGDGIINANDLM